ncbi:MAG: putative manganese-dependent inorganic diphosphatase [Deferribacteraceae bacterium]|jgi:manganese-dependent inorganic pyrophosphatase|nr:putative manganese-dependent inorganic diphosphatase [Deferribacteraceae bacterium]
MSAIYIIGHKNPDTDSIASAYAYAALKQMLFPDNIYLPARCGNANNQTKYIFRRNGLPLPRLLKDVYPKVSDIMGTSVISVNENDPVLYVFQKMEENRIQELPVTDSELRVKGLVGAPELIHLFIQEAVDQRPRYLFHAAHIPGAINGYTIHNGVKEEFRAAIIIGAMPTGKAFERIDRVGAEEAALVVGNRRNIIEYAVSRNIPAIIITGTKHGERIEADFTNYKGWVFLSGLDSSETVRRVILSSPVSNVMNDKVSTVKADCYVEDAEDIIVNSRQRVLPVVDDKCLIGVVTRTKMLHRHKTKLILMDHNEPDQAVDGIESADVLEIVDHHRIGAVKTNAPITFYAKPVGSTCTLVYQLYRSAGKTPGKKIAMILMGGIISDTVMLKSPTVTDEDRDALSDLENISGVDAHSYGMDIFSATDSLNSSTPESIINTDFKKYTEKGVTFGIGQVEVLTTSDLPDAVQGLLKELDVQKNQNELDWAMLLITDIIKEESILICTGFEAAEKRFSYRRSAPHCFLLPGVLSRKKQLLPEILRIIEELG